MAAIKTRIYPPRLKPPHARITGLERDQLQRSLRRRYEQGASIRELAAEYGRSYGAIHGMLLEAGVELRGRGGGNRKKVPAS